MISILAFVVFDVCSISQIKADVFCRLRSTLQSSPLYLSCLIANYSIAGVSLEWVETTKEALGPSLSKAESSKFFLLVLALYLKTMIANLQCTLRYLW